MSSPLARETALALVALLALSAAMIWPVRHAPWESVDEVDFIAIGHALDRTLAHEGPLAVWADVSLEPDIGRIRPVTYLYLWLSLRFAGYHRPLALAVHAVPLIALGLLAFVWTRGRGAGRGMALAAALAPLALATQERNWHLTIHAEPLLALTGMLALVAAGRMGTP